MPAGKLTDIPLYSYNPRSTNRVEPTFDRHQDSPLLRTYEYVSNQEAVDKKGEVRLATVKKVLWSPQNGAPRGVYGCIISLDDDLVNTTESVPNGTASRSHAVEKFTKFRVQGSCDRAPRINEFIEVVIVPDSPNIVGRFHKLLVESAGPPIESRQVEGDNSAQGAFASGDGQQGTPGSPQE